MDARPIGRAGETTGRAAVTADEGQPQRLALGTPVRGFRHPSQVRGILMANGAGRIAGPGAVGMQSRAR